MTRLGTARALPTLPNPRQAYHPIINQPIFDEAAIALYLIAELKAIAPIYGAASLKYATLEAGLMSQLLETVAPHYQLGLCQIGELDEAIIAEMLHLTPTQQVIHSLLAGKLEGDAQSTKVFSLADLRDEVLLERLLKRLDQLTDQEVNDLLNAEETQ
ncbi:MAG: nitroreductase family protein [Deinococcales bacterium]